MRWGYKRLLVAMLVVALAFFIATATPASAQTSDTATAATNEPAKAVDTPERRGCKAEERPVSVGGASIVRETDGQQKNWQPPGGEITFAIRSFKPMPLQAHVVVCFRWAKKNGQERYIFARPVHLDVSPDGTLLRVTVVVPRTLPKRPSLFSGDGEFTGLFVPLADVRIIVSDRDVNTVYADVSHTIGISNPFWALLLAIGTALAAFGVLTVVCHRRLRRFGYGDLDPLIRVIATSDGYASLSQLQMVLWTFVVATSAVYVMALSGELIEITTGTLVLLGISGTVTVGAKLHDSMQAAKTVASAPAVSAPPRKPHWSDLVVNEVNGQREIDIARVQMLYFTLVTACFVVMRVLSSYVIPEIPQGFQILMGISNAVYLGSKVAQPAANIASANPVPAASDSTAQPPAA
jgi:hypothetical protein